MIIPLFRQPALPRTVGIITAMCNLYLIYIKYGDDISQVVNDGAAPQYYNKPHRS